MGRRDAVGVVIPAHDEGAAIARCLRAVRDQDVDERVDVVVAANGCSDDTVEVARGFAPGFRTRGWSLQVVETEARGKSIGLNAADDALGVGGVRMYLDADTVLSRDALRRVVAVLGATGRPRLAAPALRVARPAARLTRSYARVWSALPYVREQVIGAGCYAVNAAGRRRWVRFPAIISDDKFVRLHFARDEQHVVENASFTVAFPERYRELVAVRGRWSRGNRDLARLFPELAAGDEGRIGPALSFLFRRRDLWASAPLFAMTFAAGNLVAWRERHDGPAAWAVASSAPSRAGAASVSSSTAR